MNTNPPTIPDVETQFAGLVRTGDQLAAWPSPVLGSDEYATFEHSRGQGINNHFQGIQRVGGTNTILLSGGNPYGGKRSDLFVVQLGSRAGTGRFGSNVALSQDPPRKDKLIARIKLDAKLWHAGGFTLLGDLAAIPLEGTSRGGSRIAFYDLSSPAQPVPLTQIDIVRPPGASDDEVINKASAVALTRLGNDHYLLAVWSDSEKKRVRPRPGSTRFPYWVKQPKRLDLYLSATTDILDGWRPKPLALTTEVRAWESFQAINFVKQKDGALYLIGLENTGDAEPATSGKDLAYLYRVVPPPEVEDPAPVLRGAVALDFKDKKELWCASNFSNLDAGGGVYISDNRELLIYSAYHYQTYMRWAQAPWRVVVKLSEYRTAAAVGSLSSAASEWAELYEHSDCEGCKLSLGESTFKDVKDLDAVYVGDHEFGGRVSSVRFQIPAGRCLVLYRSAGYRGTGPVVLAGNGKARTMPNLKQVSCGDQARSCRFLDTAAATKLRGAVIV